MQPRPATPQRTPSLRTAWTAAALLGALATTAWQSWLVARAARRGRALARASAGFQACPPQARARVLVLGDSTGVGVGAEAPEASLGGLLAQRFPDVEIVNHAFNGARTAGVAAQAARLAHERARIGRSPAFVPPLSWWLDRRTARTMRLLAHEARAHGATFIDFAATPAANPLPFAADGVHPNGESYRRCFDALVRHAPLGRWLQRAAA